MASAHLLRLQIEATLSDRIPYALTPAPRVIRPTAPTGNEGLDERLGGGLPVGAISELTGPECSGRTTLALSFLAGLTEAGCVCAWVDVSDALDPESAAAAGVDLERLLWVRCGKEAEHLMLPCLGVDPMNPEPSSELAASKFKVTVIHTNREPCQYALQQPFTPRCAEPQPRVIRKSCETVPLASQFPQAAIASRNRPVKPWSRLDKALRATDLLLQGGGFSAIVLDMGSIEPEFALRVPLATWYRYRAAAERTQACVVLLTRRACAKSSAEVVLTLTLGSALPEGDTVLIAVMHDVEISRECFAKFTELGRKPPQSETSVRWQSHSTWAGRK